MLESDTSTDVNTSETQMPETRYNNFASEAIKMDMTCLGYVLKSDFYSFRVGQKWVSGEKNICLDLSQIL